MTTLPLAGVAHKANSLYKFSEELEATDKFPVLFLGHGSPMNAIEDNEFVQGFKKIGQTFEKPKAILVVSAHWETRGTFVTAMEHPPQFMILAAFLRHSLMSNIQLQEAQHSLWKRNVSSAKRMFTSTTNGDWTMVPGQSSNIYILMQTFQLFK